MKFTDDRIPNMKTFEEVKLGEVFLIKGVPHMKIYEFKHEEGDYFNVVDLSNGFLDFLTDDEEVVGCDAVLKIY